MKTLQVRNVPDDVHRTLKVRAAQQGRSLSDYLLEELQRIAEQPTMEEVLARIASREPVELTESAADMIRVERDAR
jgi:plasmid stability protein